MNEREKFIVRAALIYLQSNRVEINESFESDPDESLMPPDEVDISVNGDVGPAIKEEEVEDLLFSLY